MTYRILLVCGSLRAGSTNEAALRTVADVAPEDVETTFYEGLGDLPHFNPDDDRDPLHPAVAALRAAIGESDAVLICTPEYAGAMPGSFKNLLDWTIGGGEIYEKPVAYINVSGPAAPTGGADAHDSLRKVLRYASVDLVESASVRIPVTRKQVGEDGLFHDPSQRAQFAAVLTTLTTHLDTTPPAAP